jgi:hypothetical protein
MSRSRSQSPPVISSDKSSGRKRANSTEAIFDVKNDPNEIFQLGGRSTPELKKKKKQLVKDMVSKAQEMQQNKELQVKKGGE